MQGYGYSLWLVPDEWRKLKLRYGMRHIPHVTVKTNMSEVPNVVWGRYRVGGFSRAGHFPSQYAHDPLTAAGFWCKSLDVPVRHRAHLTVAYGADGERPVIPLSAHVRPLTGELWCTLRAADTRSLDPSQWRLL